MTGERKARVLVADPSPADRERIRRFLKEDPTWRWDVLEAANADRAVQLLQSGADVFLVDPAVEPSGGTLLRPETRGDIPLILLAGNAAPNEAAAADALDKGDLTPQSLRRALRVALDERDLRRELASCQRRVEADARVIDEVVAVIAKDLRPSLQAILMEAELVELTQAQFMGPQARQQLGEMIASASHVTDVVEELLRRTRARPTW